MAGGVTGGGSATWSDRFDQGLHPAIERFNASIGFDITLLQEDLDGSIAHARMLAECGVISADEADQLCTGLETIRSEAAAGSFQPGLADEDVHFAVERRLIALLGPVGKKLHTGRSRNDQVGTDLRLWLRRRLDDLDVGVLRFQRALLAQALAQRTTAKLGGPDLPVEKILVEDGYVGPGYGLPAQSTLEAISMAARFDGILLDPVYSAKGMAGLIGLTRNGFFKAGETVVFLHTGGSAALFAYEQEIKTSLNPEEMPRLAG